MAVEPLALCYPSAGGMRSPPLWPLAYGQWLQREYPRHCWFLEQYGLR